MEKKLENFQEEKIDFAKKEGFTTFVNVGRHDERQKRLSRLIEASKKLKEEGEHFQVLLIGDGPDTNNYKEQVKQNKLEKEILFLGRKQNPYPYFKVADCMIITSDYEGYPVVFLESFVLDKPLITTKVSDYKQVEGKHGYVTEKNAEDIYKKMKYFIENGCITSEKFESEKYNQEIIKKLEKIF